MSYQISPDQSQSFQVVRQGFLQAEGLPFSEILSEEQIERAFVEEDVLFGQEEDDVYTPALTLWAFLSQVIQAGAQRSQCGCRAFANLMSDLGAARSVAGQWGLLSRPCQVVRVRTAALDL